MPRRLLTLPLWVPVLLAGIAIVLLFGLGLAISCVLEGRRHA